MTDSPQYGGLHIFAGGPESSALASGGKAGPPGLTQSAPGSDVHDQHAGQSEFVWQATSNVVWHAAFVTHPLGPHVCPFGTH